jgi:radical SAM superfamily enzyme
MIIETARAVAGLDVPGIKIHLLHLLRKAAMVRQYQKGMVKFLNFRTYVQLVWDQLEVLPPQMIIHRRTGMDRRIF